MLHERMLREHKPQYNSFFKGVLNKIESKLLKINPKDRALTGTLVDEFHAMYRDCLATASSDRQDEGRTPSGPKQSQKVSEFPASSHVSVQEQEHGPKKRKQTWHRRILGFLWGVAAIFRPKAKASDRELGSR